MLAGKPGAAADGVRSVFTLGRRALRSVPDPAPGRSRVCPMGRRRAGAPMAPSGRDPDPGGGSAMIPAGFEYHAPRSVADAIRLLGDLGPDARLLAGGHS